jgi:flavin reductase (DIM6/NTAB) family NADH-FMN oxidoreductase RutF
MLELVYAVGKTSGRDLDKFSRFNIEASSSPNLGVPLIESGCAAWLECRVLSETRTENEYDTFFAEVVAASADPRIFSNGRWSFRPDNAALHTIHHLGGGVFAVTGRIERASPPESV